MAIDTADKRVASIFFGRTFAPLIIPDNSINSMNKATLLGCYSFVISMAYVSFQLDINQSVELELLR